MMYDIVPYSKITTATNEHTMIHTNTEPSPNEDQAIIIATKPAVPLFSSASRGV
jgi:hypothetical protein